MIETPTALGQGPLSAGQISISQPIAQVDSRGIRIELAGQGADLPSVDWSALEVTTTYLLLSRNLDKFHPEVETQSREGSIRVLLTLVRDPEALPDEAYQLLRR